MENSQHITAQRVIQPNTITGMVFEEGFTKIQMKIINEIITQSQQNMTDKIQLAKGLSIPAYKIDCKKCGVTGNNKKHFLEQVSELVGKKVFYTDIDPEYKKARTVAVVPFSAFASIPDTSFVRITLNNDFIPVLHCWQHGYTLYDPKVVNSFKYLWSIRLYEMFCRNYDRDFIVFKISQLRLWLSAQKYEVNKLRDSLQKAINEINASKSIITCTSLEFYTSKDGIQKAHEEKKRVIYDMVRFTIVNHEKGISDGGCKKELLETLKTSLIHDYLLTASEMENLLLELGKEKKTQSFAEKYFKIKNEIMPFGKEHTHEAQSLFCNTIKKVLREDYSLS